MMTIILGFCAGLGIFLYGTHILSNGLQKIGASKMRTYLATITNTRVKAVLSGIGVTFFLQSSTVTNILVVGLVSGAVLNISQAFGIVLGSAIGTTLTVQILTFDIARYASLFIFLGVILTIFVKNSKWRSIGQIILSIGFIFFGIGLISSSLDPLSQNEQVLNFLVMISSRPLLLVLISMLLTALMHSSAAMIIIGAVFVTTGVLPLPAVLPLVLGANIGTTIPVVISSLASQTEGRKLGAFYFMFKTTGVTLALLLLPLLSEAVTLLPGSPERQIAHFHTLFNIAIALMFFPLLPYVAQLFYRLFPKGQETLDFKIKLDERLLKVPEEALYASKKEITKLAYMVRKNMIDRLKDFLSGEYTAEQLHQVEEIINDSYIDIQQYLLKLGQCDLTEPQVNQEVQMLKILNDIEHIGDMIMRFLEKAEEANEKNIVLSDTDVKLLNSLLHYIEESYERSIVAFRNNDEELAYNNIENRKKMKQLEEKVKLEHFNSLIDEQESNPEISAVYLDIVNQLLQVYHHSINISRTVVGII